jgi:hypothetical protein
VKFCASGSMRYRHANQFCGQPASSSSGFRLPPINACKPQTVRATKYLWNTSAKPVGRRGTSCTDPKPLALARLADPTIFITRSVLIIASFCVECISDRKETTIIVASWELDPILHYFPIIYGSCRLPPRQAENGAIVRSGSGAGNCVRWS